MAPSKLRALFLVVEDQEIVAGSVRAMLEHLGCRVLEARSAAEAEALDLRGVSVAIVDRGLPDDDGLQLARRLQSKWSIPVAVMSGGPVEPDAELPWLEKPFGLDRLRALALQVLGRSENAPDCS